MTSHCTRYRSFPCKVLELPMGLKNSLEISYAVIGSDTLIFSRSLLQTNLYFILSVIKLMLWMWKIRKNFGNRHYKYLVLQWWNVELQMRAFKELQIFWYQILFLHKLGNIFKHFLKFSQKKLTNLEQNRDCLIFFIC